MQQMLFNNVSVVQHPSTIHTQFQDIYYKAVGTASLLCLHVQGYDPVSTRIPSLKWIDSKWYVGERWHWWHGVALHVIISYLSLCA